MNYRVSPPLLFVLLGILPVFLPKPVSAEAVSVPEVVLSSVEVTNPTILAPGTIPASPIPALASTSVEDAQPMADTGFFLDDRLFLNTERSRVTEYSVPVAQALPPTNGGDRLPQPNFPQIEPPPSLSPQPEPEIPVLPPPEQLLPAPPPTTPQESVPGEVPATITVDRYSVEGSTVFSERELEEVTRPFTGSVSFAQLLQARSAVTQLYTRNGYVTSGAFIPPQTLQGGVVTIRVIEGSLEGINITGNRRLNASYVRDRLAIAARPPLNVNRLLQGLQLLQLDPLIQNLSADLEAGARPGTSLLQVRVTEADTLSAQLSGDNGRSPSVGTFRRQLQVSQANLLGNGDGISLGYSNTDGSNGLDASYTYPINARNGTLRVSLGTTSSDVIEPPFDELNISARSRYYELSYRQPLLQTPSEEVALGLTFSRQESQTELDFGTISGPYPLSPGADAEGRTRISALRFFQEWTQRSGRQVLAARSQFSLGLDFLDSTVNNNGAPDSRFFAWRGQAQWVRLLAPDTLLLVRTDIQLSKDVLVPLEQFGLGGQESIRGYRQDALLTDSGILASAEVRIPVLRVPEVQGLLQVVPFIDAGTAWNNTADDPPTDTLLSVGLGLQWRMGDRFSARLDWGIPLVDLNTRRRTLQEEGIYFSFSYIPF